MLIGCVLVYMVATVLVGLYASSRVKDSKDFMVAGRSLPLYMNFACVFATWFGAETVLSVSAKFAHKGLGFVSGDPFGASTCLILVAFFFARTFYRMELLTIGDYYHQRYGKIVEVIASLGIASSYLGWTSAQLSALGLVTNVLFPQITLNQSIIIGAVIVTIYTIFGGMWSVALTDVIQTAAIVFGLIIVAILLGNLAGGFDVVIAHAHRHDKLTLFPHVTASAWMIFIGEFLTMSLGSIPQQDVFQRVTSARDERTAFIGTLGGGLFYFGFAFVPMFIAYAATVIDPSYAGHFDHPDPREVQKILPMLILDKTPIWCQVLFFGAVLSAILSTASGTLLAPASLLTENVLQQFTKHFSDRTMLRLLRTVLIIVSVVSTTISVNSKSTMYEMVESGYSVTLVAAFVPLVCGIYWSRATTQGALCSILLAVPVWIGCEILLVDPPLKVVLLCNTSSSMDSEQRREQAEFVSSVLHSLGEGNQFQLACIDGDAAWAFNEPASPDEQTIAKAVDFLRTRESSSPLNVERALSNAITRVPVDSQVIYIGNGIGSAGSEESKAFVAWLHKLVGEKDRQRAFYSITVGDAHDPAIVEGITRVRGKTIQISGEGSSKELMEEIEKVREAIKPLWRSVPAQLYGLLASFLGMIVGSLLPQWIKHTQPDAEVLAARRGVAMGH